MTLQHQGTRSEKKIKNATTIIGNRPPGTWYRDARELLLDIFEDAWKYLDPAAAVKEILAINDEFLVIGDISIPWENVGRIFVVGAGKATYAMARACEQVLGDKLAGGWINVPDTLDIQTPLKRVVATRAGHPIPTRNGVEGARKIINLSNKGLAGDDVVLCLISGGGSALLPLPAGGITLDDLQTLNSLLLGCGANIAEINTIRKHVSAIKGGWLARALQPARVFSLIMSDVVGDDLATIASGPTVPDPTTFGDCVEILKARGIWEDIPERVKQHLLEGLKDPALETPKEGDPAFKNVHNMIIGSARLAVEKVVSTLPENLKPIILTDRLEGEAREVGAEYHRFLLDLDAGKSRLMLFGRELSRDNGKASGKSLLFVSGETTVTIRGTGRGGRNQEMLLSLVDLGMRSEINARFALMACGMDGIEGNSTAAGAIVDTVTLAETRKSGIDTRSLLENNDSNAFFSRIGDQVVTGATGTNVNDISVLVLDECLSLVK